MHYKQLLLRNHSSSFQPDERAALRQSYLDLLTQLESIDPERRQRYSELGEFMAITGQRAPW